MTRLQFLLLVLLMAAIGLALALIANRVDTLDAQLDQSEADGTALRAELNEQEAAAQALAEQVKRLGGKPVVEPDEAKQGPPGPGPTAAQVQAAVADYCEGGRCTPTVSRSQVAAAVASYCAGGACQGAPGTAEDGTDGSDGADGSDGTNGAPGPQGPGPTDEQIAAAVDAYCADGKCRGDKGEKGDPGTDGADGKDAVIVPSGADCPAGERVNAVHLLADGSLTVSCAPLIGRE